MSFNSSNTWRRPNGIKTFIMSSRRNGSSTAAFRRRSRQLGRFSDLKGGALIGCKFVGWDSWVGWQDFTGNGSRLGAGQEREGRNRDGKKYRRAHFRRGEEGCDGD